MNRNTILKNACIRFARDELAKRTNSLTPVQWVDVLNCYAQHKSVNTCAKEAEISPSMAAALYCRLSIAMVRYAMEITETQVNLT